MVVSTPDPVCDRCQHVSRYHHRHGCGACHYRECACARFALGPLETPNLALAA